MVKIDDAQEELLISIIMPTFNRASLIGETIASIRNQTYSHWELLVIDDGSEDDTASIVASIQDPRIFFYSAGRKGINGIIKNIGLQLSRGELVAFMDSDDLWHPAKLEMQVAVLREHPGAGFSLTGGYNFREPGKPTEYFYKQKEGMRYGPLFLSMFSSDVAAFAQALLFRRDCLKLTGLFNEKDSFSDVAFILTLARYYNGVIIYAPLLYRRIHDDNHSTGNWRKYYKENLALLQSYRTDPLVPGVVLRETFFRFYISAGEKHLKYKQARKAVIRFLKAWRYRPWSIVPVKKMGKVGLSFFRKRHAIV